MTEQTTYGALTELYRKYSQWHCYRDLLVISGGLVIVTPPGLHFTTFSPGSKREKLILPMSTWYGPLKNPSELEKITDEGAIDLLEKWGFDKEAERIRHPPIYILPSLEQTSPKCTEPEGSLAKRLNRGLRESLRLTKNFNKAFADS